MVVVATPVRPPTATLRAARRLAISGIPKQEIAKHLGISRKTLYRYLNRYRPEESDRAR